jgi:hypothetical protein
MAIHTTGFDRFTHRCDIQIFEGESFRFRESVKEKN